MKLQNLFIYVCIVVIDAVVSGQGNDGSGSGMVDDDDEGLSAGAVAGIVIGVIVGVILLVVLVIVIIALIFYCSKG